jgi:3-oxoacyl-[acyl-carrier protein] reductase
MSGRLSGKTALITGASKGIGRACALALAREGANVVVNYLSSESLANEVVQEIGSSRAVAIKADVSDVRGGKQLVEKAIARFKKIDILVLNAGSLAQNGSLANTDEEDFDLLYKTNVKGPFFMTKAGTILR